MAKSINRKPNFKAENNAESQNIMFLDMFPYPSGAGLHVGHPLGIASDVLCKI
jgi:leucyl-tRNA synthetase